MLKSRIRAVCHSLIFMFGAVVGVLACHTDLKGIVEFKHLVFILLATIMFSFTQTQGWFASKSQ